MILVVGIAGSGKSTQCEMLANTGEYQWLSIGQLLRTAIQDPLLKKIIDSGDVLDDQIVIPMVAKKMDELGDKPELIVDGFPRTMDQVRWLIEQNEAGKINLTRVLHLSVDENTAHGRLIKRGRTDDHDSAISERFSEYETTILSILKHLKDYGLKVFEVDGRGHPQEVHANIIQALKK